jgi:glucose/arabinose dehydrogenase
MGVNRWAVGAISSFDPKNPVRTFKTAITNLPSAGDHFTEELVFDREGRAYFGQGTATNTSVVGPDNGRFTKWLENFPNFHDFPAKESSSAEHICS